MKEGRKMAWKYEYFWKYLFFHRYLHIKITELFNWEYIM